MARVSVRMGGGWRARAGKLAALLIVASSASLHPVFGAGRELAELHADAKIPDFNQVSKAIDNAVNMVLQVATFLSSCSRVSMSNNSRSHATCNNNLRWTHATSKNGDGAV